MLVALAACAAAAAVVVAGAAAAGPTATTGPTTSVGGSAATVTGTVDPGGAATTWYVEYGTSTGYGSKTAAASVGSGTSAVGVSVSIGGLRSGTTYHYRVVASNASGTSRGSDAVLTTLVPPVVSTHAASGISAVSATLNASVDPNGRSTSYFFEFGTTTSYGSKTSAKSAGSSTSAQSVSDGIGGLQTGVTYHYRVVATSDAGTSYGHDASFRTSSAPAVVTGAPTSVTPTSATAQGSVTPNGLSTTWWFEYGTSTSYGSKTSSHSAGSGGSARPVSAALDGLKAATTYHYRLVAQSSGGKTYGADATFATIGPPAAQTGAAQSIGSDSAQVTGSVDTHGRSTTWWFDYGPTTGYGHSTLPLSAGSKPGAQNVVASLTGLSPATVYHYRLDAKSDAGTTTGPDQTFTTSGVTLAAAVRLTVFGGRVLLSGFVPTHQAGEQVVIFAQPYGGGSFRSVTTVITDASGAWSYAAHPSIATAYEASWRGGMSAPVSVGVRPVVTLRRFDAGRVVVHVAGGRSFARRIVQLQRLVRGRWTTIERVRLGKRSRAVVRLRFAKRPAVLRAAISVNQVGLGYLGSTSAAVRIRR